MPQDFRRKMPAGLAGTPDPEQIRAMIQSSEGFQPIAEGIPPGIARPGEAQRQVPRTIHPMFQGAPPNPIAGALGTLSELGQAAYNPIADYFNPQYEGQDVQLPAGNVDPDLMRQGVGSAPVNVGSYVGLPAQERHAMIKQGAPSGFVGGDIQLPNESGIFDDRIEHDPNDPSTMSELDRQYNIDRDWKQRDSPAARRRR